MFFFQEKDLFMYVFKRQSNRKRERQRQRSSIHWITPQMTATAMTGPAQSQEHRTKSTSHTSGMDPRTWAITCCLLGRTLARNWIGSTGPGTWTRHCNTECGQPKWWLNCCTNQTMVSTLFLKSGVDILISHHMWFMADYEGRKVYYYIRVINQWKITFINIYT